MTLGMLVKIESTLRAHPGLKARELATLAGFHRKDVNAFLHTNKDIFEQNDKYEWFLASPSILRVYFEQDKWVDCNSFESSLSGAGSPLDLECDSVEFIVPEKCNILLDAAARLLALCNQLCQFGKSVTVDFSDCRSALSFFNRIGFVDHLDGSVTILPKRPSQSKAEKYRGNSSALVEFGGVDPNFKNKGLINQLADAFVALSSSSYDTAASTVFGELIGNISEHSESPLQGFAALHKYGGKRSHIQTIVSDSGLGIAATLKPSLHEYYPALYKTHGGDDMALVKAVMTKGEISRFGTGRGLGFKSSREQAIKFDARLSVRQCNFSIDIEYINGVLASVKEQENLSTINGTHLCFDFFID